jgi:hypothetical protein
MFGGVVSENQSCRGWYFIVALLGKEFSTEAVKHAVRLDPLTAAVRTLDQIHAMVNEKFANRNNGCLSLDMIR